MFFEIDHSVDLEIAAGNSEAISFLDLAFTAHRMGNIILSLTRRQVIEYKECSVLSILSKRTLGQISNKLNDYHAAKRSASRIVLACSPASENNFQINNHVARVSYRLLDIHHLTTQKFLLGEGRRDVDIIGILSSEYLAELKYPRNYVTYRPLIGGGGSLNHVLQSEAISPVKGFIICDRDAVTAVPPFKHNTTAQKAFDAAVELGVMNLPLGISQNSPFFGFDVTWGRTIENMVGPNLLESFFECNSRRADRAKFVASFPGFPKLDQYETTLWRDLNLKDGTPVLTSQLNVIRQEFGSVPPSIAGRLHAISALAFPGDVLDWIVDNASAQRWTNAVRAGIAKDLAIAPYRQAVERFTLPLLTLAAGDVTARRS